MWDIWLEQHPTTTSHLFSQTALCVSYGGHLSDIQIHWDNITFVFFNSEAFQGYYLINVILFLYTTSSLHLLLLSSYPYHPHLSHQPSPALSPKPVPLM